MSVKFKILDGGKLPVKATEGAVAYDAFVREYMIDADGMIEYFLGFKTSIPKGYRGIVAPRSSLSNTIFCVPNSYGVIDTDFSGEWRLRLKPMLDLRSNQFFAEQIIKSNLPYRVGDRCCQIYFEKVDELEFEIVDSIESTDRGEAGFGTTGK